MKNWVAFLLIFLSFVGFAQYETIESVPHPKSSGTGYVSNPDNIISSNTVRKINELLADLENIDGFQVTVVCLNSIGQNVPDDFALDLGEKWRAGKEGKDDGAVILLVMDQRIVSMKTGYGTETVLTDLLTQRIQQEQMVPFFKQGDFDEGMLQGVRGVCNVLRGNPIEGDPDVLAKINAKKAADIKKRAAERNRNFFIFLGAWHLFGVAIFLIAMLFIRYKHDPYQKYNIIKVFGYWIWAILFPVTHIFLVFLSKKLMDRYRNQVRFSGRTNHLMHKLTEQEEDEFLTLGQQAEEIVKSVDYDVWVTESHDDFCILSYRPVFTKYTPCPKCGYRTYFKEYDKITLSPTYTHAGKGEKKYTCENSNCKHTDHTKYRIPKLRRSSRTSGGGWIGTRGGGGGGSWGGGGSFGGGSFGGGGSSSSW